MAQRRSVAWTELRVGILVITSFALLALGIFFIGGSSGFLTPKYNVFAYFQNTNNLKAGAEVQLEGVTIGNVRRVSISMQADPKKAVEVELRLDEKYENINRATLEANGFVRDLRTGNGTVGKLVSDDELYRRVNTMVERMDTLVGNIEHGQGTAGKFINDPAVYHKTDQILGRMQAITDRIDRGEGTLGKLSKDEALYNDFRETMKQFQTMVSAVQNGEGTAGKFIKDPTLYNSLNQTSSEVLKLLYDFRQNPKKFLTINFKLF